MKKLVFVALDSKDYKKYIKKHYPNYNIQYVSLKWQHNTIADWQDFLRKAIGDNKVDCLVGFSLGAAISLILANEIKPKKLELYSVSPVFKEALPFLSKTQQNILGKKRMAEVKKLSIKDIGPVTSCLKTKVYVGSEEVKVMKETAKSVSKYCKIPVEIKVDKNHGDILLE